MPIGVSVHRLEGNVLRQWWQISSGKSRDVYKQDAIRACIVFLASLPFMSILLWYIEGVACAKILLLSFAVWLTQFLLLLWMAQRHLFHIIEVRAHEHGLELRSLYFKRSVRWLEINDFFPIDNTRTDAKEFVLDCTNGEHFFLSTELTDSKKLFDLINRNVARPTRTYDISFQLPYGFIDSSIAAVIAITIALIFALLGPYVRGSALPKPIDFVLPALIALVCLAYFLPQIIKMPELMRAGPSGLNMRTRWQNKTVSWDEIKKISKIGPWFLIVSRLGWFIVLADKKEPMTEKLLQYRQTLLLTERRHP